MSDAFRELLRKIGSGPHTGSSLTRAEAATAARLMLTQEATPAQIGAFLIAHRIRRPTGEELAGMLDAYDDLGPAIAAIAWTRREFQRPDGETRVAVLGCPYDGRSRTAPLVPATALVLAAGGCPVLLHGGDRMPTKEGLPLADLWRDLGVDWTGLDLDGVRDCLAALGLGMVYLPRHFPLAHGLVPYRREIGKRPPLATLELIWSPYRGPQFVVAGFVHPPTETMMREAFALRGTDWFATVKGLEGSCDLPRDRAAIVGCHAGKTFERLRLNPRDSGFAGKNPPLGDRASLRADLEAALQGRPSPLAAAAVWNGGVYLWQLGGAASLAGGLARSRELLESGAAWEKLQALRATLSPRADRCGKAVENPA